MIFLLSVHISALYEYHNWVPTNVIQTCVGNGLHVAGIIIMLWLSRGTIYAHTHTYTHTPYNKSFSLNANLNGEFLALAYCIVGKFGGGEVWRIDLF